MSWTVPTIPVTGTIATVTGWATKIVNCFRYLKGLDGQVPTIESGLVIDNTDGDEYVKLPLLSTAECSTVLNAEGEVAHDEQTHRIKLYDGTAVRSLVTTADVDDTAGGTDAATTTPISSNVHYDHCQAADPHAGYILESLLTERGSVIYRNATVPAELLHGTSGQALLSGGDGADPSWGSPSGLATRVLKTADETVNNSLVLQNDNQLVLAVAANDVWEIHYIIRRTTSVGAYFRYAWTLPAAGAMQQADQEEIGVATTAAPGLIASDSTAADLIAAAAADYWIMGWAIYVGGANAGNVQLQWAQAVAEESDTKVLTNSFLLAFKLN